MNRVVLANGSPLLSAVFALALLASCAGCRDASPQASGAVRDFQYEIVRTYPHDAKAFTQGLVFAREDGQDLFYEGTGLHGRSFLRRVDVETGRVLKQSALAEKYFGEGIAVVGERIYQLTWQARTGFIYDRRTFERMATFEYQTEGWGLTYDPGRKQLILSDGSSRLFFLDPESLAVTNRIEVRDGGRPVRNLNELEWIDGEIYANVWQTDWIIMIDPADGRVTGRVRLDGLVDAARFSSGEVDVLNGIAYDAEGKRLFVTGKLWSQIFEIRLRGTAR